MLKKTYRLTSIRLKSPKSIPSKNFNIRFAENYLAYPRFGFVISKKIDKRAVVRNSVKRKLSASIEEIFDRIKDGADFVIYPRQSVANLSKAEVQKEMENVLVKEGLLK